MSASSTATKAKTTPAPKAKKPVSKPKTKKIGTKPDSAKSTAAPKKANPTPKKISPVAKKTESKTRAKPKPSKKPAVNKESFEEQGPEFYDRIDKLLDQQQGVDTTPRWLRTRNWTMAQWDAERKRQYELDNEEQKAVVEDIGDNDDTEDDYDDEADEEDLNFIV